MKKYPFGYGTSSNLASERNKKWQTKKAYTKVPYNNHRHRLLETYSNLLFVAAMIASEILRTPSLPKICFRYFFIVSGDKHILSAISNMVKPWMESVITDFSPSVSVGILRLSQRHVSLLYSKKSGEPTRCISICPGVLWLEADTTHSASHIRPSEVSARGVSLWFTSIRRPSLTIWKSYWIYQSFLSSIGMLL